MFLNVAAFNLFLLFFQSFGIAEGASAAIVFNWDILSFVPLTGLGIAVISMTGKTLGANDMPAISSLMKTAFIIGLGYSGILAVLFFLFKSPMINIFLTDDPQSQEIYALSQFMMTGLISYVMADAVIQIAGAILRGTGDTKWLMFTSISLHWFMLIVQVFMMKVLHRQSHEVWTAFVIMIIATAIIYYLRLRQKRWLMPGIRHQVMRES